MLEGGTVGVTTTGVGIVTTTGTSTNIAGLGTITSNFYETSNFIQVPDSVIGIEKIFKFDTSSVFLEECLVSNISYS